MRTIILLALLLLAVGCTTVKPVEMAPEQLRARISAGEVINKGETVLITTEDGHRYEFVVAEVTADKVVGKDVEVAIADIVAVQTREISYGKTAGYGYWTIILVGSLALVAVMATGNFVAIP